MGYLNLNNGEITEIVSPDPGIILESLRSIGYSFENAIADIIDNSISADAKNIWFDTIESAKYIMISDDGNGMTDQMLKNSLRLGSMDPLLKRNINESGREDLGRFGLGLKLASFSYCRVLTVASKTKNGDIAIRQWDLDYVRERKEWAQKIPKIQDYPIIKEKLEEMCQGTVVYWEKLDRFTKNEEVFSTDKEKTWYGEQIKKVNRHLEMIFHRFLEDQDFRLILPDGSDAQPWDPFLPDNPTVKPLPSNTSIKNIEVHPYIMPHKSKFKNETEYKEAAGPKKTWINAQGFYVYRGKRLITAGSWLGLKGFTKSHETDLARIQLDISSDDDGDWLLDVKKSTIKIPRQYSDDLKKIATSTRDQARKVRLYRGQVPRRENPGNYDFLWKMDKNRAGEVRYRLNRDHPVIQRLINNQSANNAEINQVLRLIEECVPTQGIILEEMKNPDSIPEAFDDMEKESIKSLLKTVIDFLKLDSLSMEEKRNRLLLMEPFSGYKEIVDQLLYEGI